MTASATSLRGILAWLLIVGLLILVVAFVVEAVLQPSGSGRVSDTALSPGSGEYLEVIGIIDPPQKPFPYSLVGALGG